MLAVTRFSAHYAAASDFTARYRPEISAMSYDVGDRVRVDSPEEDHHILTVAAAPVSLQAF